MGFQYPQLLLLLFLIPPVMKYAAIKGRRPLNILRLILMILAVLYLAGPNLNLVEKGVDLVVIADRSVSIGSNGLRDETEIMSLLGRTCGPRDRIGVVVFGNEAAIGTPLRKGQTTNWFDRTVEPNGSTIADALRLAARITAPSRRTRLLLLSDGLYTGESPLDEGVLSELGNLPVWYRPLGSPRIGDIAAGEIILPPMVAPGTGFVVRFSIESEQEKEVSYTLSRNRQPLRAGKLTVQAGINYYFARDLADQEGILEYQLDVEAEADPVPDNNRSQALLRVSGRPRVLLASGPESGGGLLLSTLQAADIPVDLAPRELADWSPARLDPYRVVVLENLPLERLGHSGAKALANSVEHGVSALLVTGGEGSFGQGGYHKSPIDPLLPISMELREEQKRGIMAMGIVMDRSGSMAAPIGVGKSKMDLANMAASEGIRLLSSMDQVCVFAVDSQSHRIVGLSQADDTGKLIDAVMRIQSMGGGIFVYTGLEAAAEEVRKSNLPTRHILLFADAADSEEQEGCIALADTLMAENIGISVVGLGTPADVDAEFLRELAARGGGEVYFTSQAMDLPRIFSQEIIRVSQRGFVKEPSGTKVLPDMLFLGLQTNLPGPALDGYNLTSLRPGASCMLMTTDDYKSPVVAFRQKGRASVAAITAEVDGPYSGEFATWEKTPELILSLIRRVASDVTRADVKAYTSIRRGEAELRLEFDEDLALRLRAEPLEAVFLPPQGGDALPAPLVWLRPDTAVARLSLTQPGHYLPVVDIGKGGVIKAPPISLSYSPEFLPNRGIDGEKVLDSLAISTGGAYLGSAENAFSPEGTVARKSSADLKKWVALLLLLSLIFEIAEKRLAICELIQRNLKFKKMSYPP